VYCVDEKAVRHEALRSEWMRDPPSVVATMD